MLAVLDEPAIRARAHAISLAEYHRMGKSGAIAENVELIRGALVEKMPKSPLHSRLVVWLLQWLMREIPKGFSVWPEQPLTLTDSEPEPDLAVVAGNVDDHANRHPASAELVIEVAVTSEPIDRLKLHLYAEAGVRECWLVLAEERVVERHTEPDGSVYRRVERVISPDALESTVFPHLRFPPDGLFRAVTSAQAAS